MSQTRLNTHQVLLFRLQNYAVTATAGVPTPSPIELQAAAQALQNNLGSSMLDIKQAAASFDSGAALQQVRFLDSFSKIINFRLAYFKVIFCAMQVQSGIENTVTIATAPFDVFSGNWFLNLLLFGVAFLVASSIATGPKQ